MAEIARNSTGLSGEYFVAAELYRRGWSVGMTIGNAKSVDLYAEKIGIVRSVQVKSIYKKKNIGWPIMREQVRVDVYYIFVNLNADVMASPEYYILESFEVLKYLGQYTTRGIVNLTDIKSDQFYGRWDKLEAGSGMTKSPLNA